MGGPGEVSEMLSAAHASFLPVRAILGGDPTSPLVRRLPAMEGRLDRPGQGFVCVGHTCQEPASSADELVARLAEARA